MTKAGKIIALTSIILCAVSFINKGLKYSNIPQFIFEYEKNDNGGITISDYTGKNSDVIIPDTIGKLPVTEIGYMGYNQKIKSVTMVTDFLRQKSYYKITRKQIKQITIHSN